MFSPKVKALTQPVLDSFFSKSPKPTNDENSLSSSNDIKRACYSHEVKAGKVIDVSRKHRREENFPKKVVKSKFFGDTTPRTSPASNKRRKKSKPTDTIQTQSLRDFLDGKIFSSPKNKTENKDISRNPSQSTTLESTNNNDKKVESKQQIKKSEIIQVSDQTESFSNKFQISYEHEIKKGEVFDSSKPKTYSSRKKEKVIDLSKSENSSTTRKKEHRSKQNRHKKSPSSTSKSSSKRSDKSSQESKTKSIEKKPNFQRSDSFQKYGVVFPSVDDILKKQDENKKEAEALALFKGSVSTSAPKSLKSLIQPEASNEKLVDRKHSDQFKSQMSYSHEIKKGEVFDLSKPKTYSSRKKEKVIDLSKSENSSSTRKKEHRSKQNRHKKSSSSTSKSSSKRSDKSSQKSKTKSLEKKPNFQRSDSFDKYGVVLPSVDDILKKQNENKKEADALASFKSSVSTSAPKSLKSLIQPEASNEKLLDCKHLDKDKLKDEFLENLSFMNSISNGHIHNDRHTLYYNGDDKSKLIYNTSTLVFTQEQLGCLLDFFHEYMGTENTEYFLMVLIPELCLKIFMSTYSMTKQEAMDYLEWRPCE